MSSLVSRQNRRWLLSHFIIYLHQSKCHTYPSICSKRIIHEEKEMVEIFLTNQLMKMMYNLLHKQLVKFVCFSVPYNFCSIRCEMVTN